MAERSPSKTVDGKLDPFGHVGQAQSYAMYRPKYPQQLYDHLAQFLSHSEPRRLAVDIATGTGQVAVPVSQLFEKVIAVDRSQSQLDKAEKRDNIEYRLATANRLDFIADGSVNLVTLAQALHWMNAAEFFDEAKRMLTPGGCLMVSGYAICRIHSSERAQELLAEHYRRLETYWDCDRKSLDSQFADIEFPFARVERKSFPVHQTLPVEAFIGYLRTWSAYNTYKKGLDAADNDILIPLSEQLRDIARTQDPPDALSITWPFFAIFAAKQ
eukprot:GILK01005787.1.p1 GENE.GILK01005787.1~~GILK01005787.1.p1  ORF type:complete len:297 (-),score=36.00 GILK01005787.1:467-1279(-)